MPALRNGNLVFTSGQLPMRDGNLEATGKVGDGHGLVPASDAKELAALCALNAIAAIKSVVGDLEKVTQVVKVVGFVASDPLHRPAGRHQRRERAAGHGVRRQGAHARSAVGVAALPLDAPVEVEVTVSVAD